MQLLLTLYVTYDVHTYLIFQGSWIVRQSVGSTPCLLGKAVDCNYIRGPNYLEVKLQFKFSSVTFV